LPAVTFLLRRTDFHGVVRLAGWRLKLYTISAAGRDVSEALLDRARETASAALPGGDGCGFLIVHSGEDAIWLLVHWWQGDILCQRLLRATDDTRFAVAEPHLFACVWELHVIDHERRSWASNGLGARSDGVRSYLGDAITVAAGTPLGPATVDTH
jgi:hypothetical protein